MKYNYHIVVVCTVIDWDKIIRHRCRVLINHDKDEPLLSSILSRELVPTSTHEAEAPHATTFSTVVVEASWVEGKIISEQGAPSHI
jgi:hypothetical protein